MTDYKALYLTLFNAITYAVDQMENSNFGIAKNVLIRAQQDTEDKYIEGDESDRS